MKLTFPVFYISNFFKTNYIFKIQEIDGYFPNFSIVFEFKRFLINFEFKTSCLLQQDANQQSLSS